MFELSVQTAGIGGFSGTELMVVLGVAVLLFGGKKIPEVAKGIGEGTCMAAPAAIASAVTDALSGHGVEVTELPVHGGRIWEWLHTRERGEP